MTTRSSLAATVAAIASLLACGSALAGSPLAQYSQLTGDPGYSLTYNNGVLATTKGAYPVQFSFQTGDAPAENLPAAFSLSARAEGAAYQITAFGHAYDAQDFTGAFRFVYTGTAPLMLGGQSYGAGDVLLAGTFSDAVLYGPDAGSTGAMTDSRFAGGAVDFTTGFPPTSAD